MVARKKEVFSDIGLFNDGAFYYYIRQRRNNYWVEIYRSFFHDDLFDDYSKFESYEEALAECIKKSINILKDENTGKRVNSTNLQTSNPALRRNTQHGK